MKPIISKGNMSDFGYKMRNKICECKPQCERFVSVTTYNDGMLLCEHDAMQHTAEMTNLLYGLVKPKNAKWSNWTVAEEKVVIRIANEFGKHSTGRYRNGVVRAIMQELGKTKNQVAGKMMEMRGAGKI